MPPKAKTIAESWETFRRAVLAPIRATPIQVQETRRAFYAGCAFMMEAVVLGADEIEGEGEEAMARGEANLTALDAELKAFAKDLAEGRA